MKFCQNATLYTVMRVGYRDHPYIMLAYFCTFSYPPTQYVIVNIVLNVSKNCNLLNPQPPNPFAYIIYGWFLSNN